MAGSIALDILRRHRDRYEQERYEFEKLGNHENANICLVLAVKLSSIIREIEAAQSTKQEAGE